MRIRFWDVKDRVDQPRSIVALRLYIIYAPLKPSTLSGSVCGSENLKGHWCVPGFIRCEEVSMDASGGKSVLDSSRIVFFSTICTGFTALVIHLQKQVRQNSN